MKNILILISFVVLASCSKDIGIMSDVIVTPTYYPNSIQAGQTSGTGIWYTDIPDYQTQFHYPGSGDMKYLDINGDSIDDVYFSFSGNAAHTYNHFIFGAHVLNGNELIADPLDSVNVDTLNFGSQIDASEIWQDNATLLCNYSWSVSNGTTIRGLWYNQADKYVGIKIKASGKTLYGWIRISCQTSSLTIKDYACTGP